MAIIRQEALNYGVENAFDFPRFVPAYIRPLFCRGVGPFRWVELSGDPQDIYKTDARVKAPIVIGRDHLDSGSVASPNRETESMIDGSDAVSDWPLLNALLSAAGGATWVSLHHGGGVGMGFSQHAGVVIVADGTEAANKRLARVLWNDPAVGVMRHADAGYKQARQCARENNLNLGAIKI